MDPSATSHDGIANVLVSLKQTDKKQTLEGLCQAMLDFIQEGGLDDDLSCVVSSQSSMLEPVQFTHIAQFTQITLKLMNLTHLPSPTSSTSDARRKVVNQHQCHGIPASEWEKMADGKLASHLLGWATSGDTNMKTEWRSWTGFAKLSCRRNKTVNEIVVLTCVHQCARGAIGAMPRGKMDKSLHLLSKNKEVHRRGKEMAELLVKFFPVFCGLKLTVQGLINGNLCDKIDNCKKNVAIHGLFDPEADSCRNYGNCSGAHWKQFWKLNSVIEGPHEKASQAKEKGLFSISDECNKLFEKNELIHLSAVDKKKKMACVRQQMETEAKKPRRH